MKKTMVIKKINHEYPFMVVGFDGEGKNWSCVFYSTHEEAIEGTKGLLNYYNKSNYSIIAHSC